MCRNMVDIQSATAEFRRGKKKKEEEETTAQKYNGLAVLLHRAAITRMWADAYRMNNFSATTLYIDSTHQQGTDTPSRTMIRTGCYLIVDFICCSLLTFYFWFRIVQSKLFV